ncbi:MAG: hypothetical protein HUJ98_06545, partial [Bacteroidaceae bacterium]|nr:hypothetical protein [Bacteroidaceae bacterium]
KYILWTVEKVFTSNSILATYEKDEFFKDYLYKIEAVEFPTFVKPEESQNDTDFGYNPEDINCVYAGNLFLDSRNPKNMLELFCQMKGPVLHIYGKGCEEMVDEYAAKSEGHIIRHGFIEAEKVPAMLKKADVLISLNNSIPNLVPSKLFQYFATGKPILNMCYFDECPTLPYMEKYELGHSIIDDKFDAEKVLEFCQENKGKTIPYEDVEEIYKEATPKFVAEELLS